MVENDSLQWARVIADFRVGLFWAATSTFGAALVGWAALTPV